MIKLGVNSVLFGGFDFATACKHIALAGYDGIEISAIKGMCEHLDLDRWQEQAAGPQADRRPTTAWSSSRWKRRRWTRSA